MSTTVSLPDGTSLEFADGTDPSVIQRAVAQARMHVQAAASSGPDFSDVIGGAGGAREQKRAELTATLAAQKSAPNAGLGATPPQSVGDRAVAFGDRFVSGAADTIASIPEGVTSLWNKYQGAVGGDALQVPEFQYPTIGAPGGFLDMKAQRADIAHQADAARERLLASEGDPEMVAAADSLALGAGYAAPLPGLRGAKAAEGLTPAAARIPSQVLLDEAPGDAAFLANRAKVMPTIPGAEEPFLRPGAFGEALAPHEQVLQVGRQADDAAQRAALGLSGDASDPALAALRQRYEAPLVDGPPLAPPPAAAPPSLAEIFGDARRPVHESLAPVPETTGPVLETAPLVHGTEPPVLAPAPSPDAVPTLRNALTGEELPLDTPTTGTMHAITRAEQNAAGLPRTSPAVSSDPWEQARQVFEQDPQAPRQLAQEVAAKPRPLSDFENHLLAHDRAKLKPAYEGALSAEEQALATGDPEQIAAAKLHRLSVERDFQTNADAADLGGTESGKGLQARQKQITEDYQPLNLIRRYKVANMGEEAPDAVRAKLVDISQQLEAAQTRLAAAEDRAQTLEAQRMIHSENLDTARVVRSKGRATVTAGLDQEYSDLSAQWRKATGLAQSGVNPDQAAILAKMARNRVRAGVTNLHDLVDGIFQDARPHLDTLEPQDVRDAIAGASPKGQAAAKKQAVSDFAALRREARVLNALDASQGKLAAAGDSRAAGALRKEVARWQAEADKISAGTGPRQAGGPLSDPERLRAALQRNTARQAELRDQIASGTFVSKTRAPLADSSLVAARADTQRLQRAADAIIGRRELQNRSFLQKALDLTAATARFTPLTSVTGTLPKLGAAAGMRSLIFRPAEQLLSVADPYLPLLKHFANEAPVEGGGVGLSALKKSYQGFFSKEAAAEAAAHLRGEEGPLALAMGKAHPPSGAPAFMDYPAHLHAAVKSPTVVAGFNWAMETQARALRAAGKGDLLLDASTRAEMESRAWEVAMRDIMLNDNSAVNRFNRALDKLPQDSAATRMGIATVRSQMPIVKVPANYVTQITDYFNGLPKAAGAMTATVYRGMKALPAAEGRTIAEIVHAGLQASPPGYADYIMRNMKRGRLGAALAALVTTGAVEVGGYYRKGEHRSEDDLQPGEIRIGGKDVGLQLPHNLLHSPAIEFMQAVGTIKRSKTLAQGLGTSALGIAGQVPFFEEAQRVGRDLPDNPAKFAGMAARQITEPPDMQKLARILDQSKERTTAQKVEQGLGLAGLQVGDWKVPEIAARKRVPHGSFWHQLLGQEELGIPGLREKVR